MSAPVVHASLPSTGWLKIGEKPYPSGTGVARVAVRRLPDRVELVAFAARPSVALPTGAFFFGVTGVPDWLMPPATLIGNSLMWGAQPIGQNPGNGAFRQVGTGAVSFSAGIIGTKMDVTTPITQEWIYGTWWPASTPMPPLPVTSFGTPITL